MRPTRNRSLFIMVAPVLVAAAVTGAVTSPAADAPAVFPVRVHTEGGIVQGTVDRDVVAYMGIPYARPPVGALRWRAPQPVEDWEGVREAGQLAADCMQTPLGPPPASGRHPMAEDCLYLNVWRPFATVEKLPVMVWIHGGAFVNGGSSSLDGTGEGMAARGLVFVNFNYRLGRFGYFGFPALNEEHPEEAKGNYGFMDQIAALQWVRRNIADFGGDPGNVTVVGESAGGMSVNMLLTSPATHGLFERAVVMSGAGRNLPRERRLVEDLPGAASATSLGLGFAQTQKVVGQDAQALAALRALDAGQIASGLNMATLLLGDESLFAGSVIDGRLLVETPEAAFAAAISCSSPSSSAPPARTWG